MSAIVCGKRSPSSFFEDPIHQQHHQTTKRIRRYSSLSPPSPPAFGGPSPIDRLQEMFPHIDPKLIERVLEESGHDLDSAIKSLSDLRLEPTQEAIAFVTSSDPETTIQHTAEFDAYGTTNLQSAIPSATDNEVKEEASSADGASVDNLPKSGAEWVEVLVREMSGATNIEDAKARASRVLEVLEKSIMANAGGTEAMQGLHKENIMLKEQLQTLLKENNVLKRAVTIQHERQKEYEGKNQELQHLKQLVSQYQEQVSKLEVSNYALAMHLKQAQQGNSMSGRYHPDVF